MLHTGRFLTKGPVGCRSVAPQSPNSSASTGHDRGMPFTYDNASGLFVTAVGTAVQALTVNRTDRTGVIVQKYNGHNAAVTDLLVTMHMLFSCSDELICHNLGTGREKWRLLKELGIPVARLAVLGDILVCCLADCSVAMVNIRRGVLLYYTPLKGERVGGIPYVAVDAFNRMAYVQGNRCVNGWSLAVGRRVFNTDLVVGQIYSSAHSAVYKILYGGAGDGGVRAYKVPTGETLWTALGHTENVNAIIASEHLELVISGSSDGTLRAWDIRNGTPRWSTVVFDDRAAITEAACAEWEGRVVIAGENGVLAMFDAYNGEQVWRTMPGPMGYSSLKIVASNSLAGLFQRFSSGYMILTEDHDGSVVVRDLHVSL
jgi:WD40 repeat protein